VSPRKKRPGDRQPQRGWVLPATAIRQGFDSMVGRTQHFVVPEGLPTFDELLARFGSTSALAEGAGYGRPGQFPRGSKRWRDRESFMRRLRRYRSGENLPSADSRRLLEGLGNKVRRRQATPTSLDDVVDLVDEHGLTFRGVVLVQISSDTTVRTFTSPGFWISPRIWAQEGCAEPVRGRHWPDAVGPLSNAMGRAYGVGPMHLLEVEYLHFSAGRARGARAIEV
jgi:hypothetical protein